MISGLFLAGWSVGEIMQRVRRSRHAIANYVRDMKGYKEKGVRAEGNRKVASESEEQ